jgi:Rrf2 family protein
MALYGAPVEYALHTLLNLTYAPEGTAPSARDLAEFQRLPVAFTRKQLTQLAKAGIVHGAEGVRGGWRLARDPAAISVLDVTDAVHGGEPLFECRNIRARCALWDDASPPAAAVSGVCAIHQVMLTAEAAMRRELAGQSLADIAARVRAKSSAGGMDVIPEWFAGRYAARRTAQTEREEGERASD